MSTDSNEASGNTDLRPLRLAEARVTPGFEELGLCTIYVRSPHYLNDPQPAAALAESVKALLRLARATGCKRVALPPLSTAPLAYPLEEAAQITTREIKAFLARDKKLDEVRLVLPSPALYEVYRRRKVWG